MTGRPDVTRTAGNRSAHGRTADGQAGSETGRFTRLFARAGKRGAFIPFFMLGDPTPEDSLTLIRAAIDAGADGLELGIPFSDPIADGPVIQASAIRATAAGADVDRCLDMIAELRSNTSVPIGLLIYYNLVHRRTADAFCRDAAAAGVDAVLAADLPFGQASPLGDALATHGLGSVYLVSPNTPDARARTILDASTAYTYAVGVMGTTGARDRIAPETEAFVRRLRGLTERPFAVGFGVGSPEQARQILGLGADGVIVGSALIRIIEEHKNAFDRAVEEICRFVRGVRCE